MIVAQGVLFIICIAATAFSFGGAAGVYPATASFILAAATCLVALVLVLLMKKPE
jgi:hypothetical protein